MKLMVGYTDGSIKPSGFITKAEFAKLLSSINTDFKYNINIPKYNDISSHWAEVYIGKCAEKGLFKDIVGSFKPDTNITRAEAIYAINRLLGREVKIEASVINPFTDLTSDYKYYVDILESSYEHT